MAEETLLLKPKGGHFAERLLLDTVDMVNGCGWTEIGTDSNTERAFVAYKRNVGGCEFLVGKLQAGAALTLDGHGSGSDRLGQCFCRQKYLVVGNYCLLAYTLYSPSTRLPASPIAALSAQTPDPGVPWQSRACSAGRSGHSNKLLFPERLDWSHCKPARYIHLATLRPASCIDLATLARQFSASVWENSLEYDRPILLKQNGLSLEEAVAFGTVLFTITKHQIQRMVTWT